MRACGVLFIFYFHVFYVPCFQQRVVAKKQQQMQCIPQPWFWREAWDRIGKIFRCCVYGAWYSELVSSFDHPQIGLTVPGKMCVSVSLFTLKWVQRCMYTFDWMEPAICLIVIHNCFGCILFHRFLTLPLWYFSTAHRERSKWLYPLHFATCLFRCMPPI